MYPNEFDKIENVELDFPKSEWEWYIVSTPEEGRSLIYSLAFKNRKAIFGQARWFSEKEGVVLVKRSDLISPPVREVETKIEEPKKKLSWFEKIRNFLGYY